MSPTQTNYQDEVLASLSETPPRIPPHYFYDETGSRLFDAICELPEYYPTRTETGILQAHAQEMAKRIGPGAELIEYGSGSSTKTTLLLDALDSPAVYIPIDVSKNHLNQSAERIRTLYPDLMVQPLCANFGEEIQIPKTGSGRRVGFFPGSTLGNMDDQNAAQLLARMARTLGPAGLLLIGVDLVKPEEILVPAYDDAQGITAQFNRNILTHLKRLVGLQVSEEEFAHRAVWNRGKSRIEMWLEAKSDQTLELAGQTFPFKQGEMILTEYSHKYTPKRLMELAQEFEPLAHWSDDKGWFLVQLMQVRR